MGAFKKIVFVGALAAAGAVIAKKLMDSSDSNAWESAGGWDSTPSTDWSRKAADSASATAPAADETASSGEDAADTVEETADDAAKKPRKKADQAAADEAAEAADQAESTADAATDEGEKS